MIGMRQGGKIVISATITLNDGAVIKRLFNSWELLTDWLERRHGYIESVEAKQV